MLHQQCIKYLGPVCESKFMLSVFELIISYGFLIYFCRKNEKHMKLWWSVGSLGINKAAHL